MGMFDEVICEYPLPDGRTIEDFGGNLVFQTKSLESVMDNYKITVDGQLLIFRYETRDTGEKRALFPGSESTWPVTERINERWEVAPCSCDRQLPFHGVFNFYSQALDGTWCEYVVKFTDGQLETIFLAAPHQIHHERQEILQVIEEIKADAQ